MFRVHLPKKPVPAVPRSDLLELAELYQDKSSTIVQGYSRADAGPADGRFPSRFQESFKFFVQRLGGCCAQALKAIERAG